jgi:hypothetical protein
MDVEDEDSVVIDDIEKFDAPGKVRMGGDPASVS